MRQIYPYTPRASRNASPRTGASQDGRVPPSPQLGTAPGLVPSGLPDPAQQCRSIAAEPSKRFCRPHAARGACQTGYSVRRRRRAAGQQTDGRDELSGQDALQRRYCLHSKLSYKQLQQGSFRWPPIMDGVVKLSPVEFAASFDHPC
jgi:hypothetical protein